MNTTSRNYFLLSGFIALIALIMFLTSCKSGNKPAVNTSHRDTTKTLALFLGYGLQYVDMGPVDRVTVDTVTWVGKDSTTRKLEQTKLTYYVVNLRAQTDSAIAATYKIPEFDSTGKPYLITITNVNYPAEWVRDSVTDFNEDVNYLKSLIPKKDTLK